MNILKNNLQSDFTQIPNSLLRDATLSWKAKGIFCYLAMHSDDYTFHMSHIETQATDGKGSLQSGIQELEDKGYLTRERQQDDRGVFTAMKWTIKLPQQCQKPIGRKTHLMDKPSDGKSATNNTNTKNTKENNTKKNIGGFVPPSAEECVAYFKEKGYVEEAAKKFHAYYDSNNWKDGKGNPVKNWKQKAIGVWFKDENKIKDNQGNDIFFGSVVN